jgi:hypothetical protein
MLGMGAFNGIVFIVSVAIVLVGVTLALKDRERVWTLGMAVTTALYAPLGVVLAILYIARVRRI